MDLNIRAFNQETPSIGSKVYVDPFASVIGKVSLGDDVSVWPMAVIRGDVNIITIGNKSNIQDGSILHVTHDGPYTPGGHPLTIGEGVTVGHQVTLHACSIGNYCLIGIGSIILDKAIIEDNVMIGAGSLVPPGKHLESGYLYIGRPAKKIRKLTPEELGNLEYSSEHYVHLKNEYLKNSNTNYK